MMEFGYILNFASGLEAQTADKNVMPDHMKHMNTIMPSVTHGIIMFK